MSGTPLQQLEELETEVHRNFGNAAPSATDVEKFLEGLVSSPTAAALTIAAILAFLKANGITLATASGWIAAAYGKWGGPRCPVPGCGRKAATIDPATGESVCSQGHRWRP